MAKSIATPLWRWTELEEKAAGRDRDRVGRDQIAKTDRQLKRSRNKTGHLAFWSFTFLALISFSFAVLTLFPDVGRWVLSQVAETIGVGEATDRETVGGYVGGITATLVAAATGLILAGTFLLTRNEARREAAEARAAQDREHRWHCPYHTQDQFNLLCGRLLVLIEASPYKLGRTNQTSLSAYFRNLYGAVKFLDDSQVLLEKEKQRLMKMLRGQLSNPKLYIFFFNAVSRFGQGWYDYIKKYELLKNLPFKYVAPYDQRHFFEQNYEQYEHGVLRGWSRDVQYPISGGAHDGSPS